MNSHVPTFVLTSVISIAFSALALALAIGDFLALAFVSLAMAVLFCVLTYFARPNS
jgi:hypothetical protein